MKPNTNALMVHGMLLNDWHKIVMTKTLIDQGRKKPEVARMTGVNVGKVHTRLRQYKRIKSLQDN